MNKLALSEEIKKILFLLNENGKGYIVGGYIRDSLLGYEPKDCDFCTDISYERLKEIFKEYSPKEMGKSFGIIQIIMNNKIFEIAKLRKEKDFGKTRKEVEIEFISDIFEDLKRRDLTINSIAYDGEKYFYIKNAMEDIEKRLVRFVGIPNKRIEEDPLRILRAIRIVLEKNLTLEKESEKAIIENSYLLKKLSMERVQEELFKILKSKNSSENLKKFYDFGIFNNIFNTLKLTDKNLNKLRRFRGHKILTFANFFLFSRDEIKKLKISKIEKKSILNIIDAYNIKEEISQKTDIKKIMRKIGKKDAGLFFYLIANKKNRSFIYNTLKEIKTKKEPVEIRDLNISGQELLKIGVKQGKDIKNILEKILDLVIDNPELNKKENILVKVKEIICKNYH